MGDHLVLERLTCNATALSSAGTFIRIPPPYGLAFFLLLYLRNFLPFAIEKADEHGEEDN
jgi:hypothetical protein